MALTVKDFNELPVCFSVDDLARVLGVSRSTAFNLTKTPGFPAVRIHSKRVVVLRDKLKDWLEDQAKKPLPDYSYKGKGV